MPPLPSPEPAQVSPGTGPACAVIDIGSNTIKLLVAHRRPDGSLGSLAYRTLEARISAGLGAPGAGLGAEGMARGLAAVTALLEQAAPHRPLKTALVATSAVRDAANGPAFADQILRATGHAVSILSGDEEAALIGRGLTCDPALRHLSDFYLFDLGGGSLECLCFRQRRPIQALSLRLGCVRLTEKFIADPSAPVPPESLQAIRNHVNSALARAGFALSLPPGSPAVGTGGTVSTVRAILGARQGIAFEQTPPFVPTTLLRSLLAELAPLPLSLRRQIPGLPPERADVFPCALQTLISVAAGGRFPGLLNSVYNLRWGVADSILPSGQTPAP